MFDDESFIKQTFLLAKKGEGSVEPNPAVGAVVVKNCKVVGRGYHKFFGGPHAEVYAIKQAGNQARGATLYVNLEPCSHWGKTPPCTGLIIKSGIKKVISATYDTNKLVNGGGFIALRKAGVKVENGVREKEAKELNAPFFKFHKTGLPYVIVKWAMTLDGKIATHTGDSKWISSSVSRRFAKNIRKKVQAVVIGIQTAIKDNPRLIVGKRTCRIILDSSARLPLNSYIVKTALKHRTIVAVSSKAPEVQVKSLQRRGCEIIRANGLKELFRIIARMGIIKVLVEGGGEVHFSAFNSRLADEVLIFIAPKIIGGRDAKTPVEGEGISSVAKALKLKSWVINKIGADIVIKGKLTNAKY